MALVLRRQTLAAWRCGGQQWKAWNLRCVSVQCEKKGACRTSGWMPFSYSQERWQVGKVAATFVQTRLQALS